MFRFTRPSTAEIGEQVAAVADLVPGNSQFLSLAGGMKTARLPFAFAHDFSRTCIGHGQPSFVAAAKAFERWAAFDLGWVHVANPSSPIAVRQIVAVEVQSLGMWSLNLSQILETVNTETSIGFLYSTTKHHIEEGEERFLITFDIASGKDWYELEAVSRPRNALAWLGMPITRAFQRRFRRDSFRRMQEAAEINQG